MSESPVIKSLKEDKNKISIDDLTVLIKSGLDGSSPFPGFGKSARDIIDSISVDVLNKIPQSAVAEGIKTHFFLYPEGKNMPKILRKLATEETLQEALLSGTMSYMHLYNRPSQFIQAHLDLEIPKVYLDLATEDTMRQIQYWGLVDRIVNFGVLTDKNTKAIDENILQKALLTGLIIRISRGEISKSLMRLATEETLAKIPQTCLLHGIVFWILNNCLKTRGLFENSLLQIKELPIEFTLANKETKLEAFYIAMSMSFGPLGSNSYFTEISPEFIQFAKEKGFLQSALLKGLSMRMEKGYDIPDPYLKLVTQETIDELKKHQDKVYDWIKLYIHKEANIPKAILTFVEPETLNKFVIQECASGFGKEMSQACLAFLKIKDAHSTLGDAAQDVLLQQHLFEELKTCVIKDIKIPDEYAQFATEDTYQQALLEGIRECFKDNSLFLHHRNLSYLSKDIINKAKEDKALQQILSQRIKQNITNGHNASFISRYAQFATEDTYQQALIDGLKSRAMKNIYMGEYLPLLSAEKREELMEYIRGNREEVALNILTDLLASSDLDIANVIRQEVLDLDEEELESILFDKTRLPIGIKIHTNNKVLATALEKTGGFIAHEQNTCFVIKPMRNFTTLKVLFRLLERVLNTPLVQNRNTPLDHYVQICSPKRLDNIHCGIATVVFMLLRDNKYSNESLKTNIVKGQAITIYDAGGVVDMYIPDQEGAHLKLEGRTDILFCKTLRDIDIVNTIMTLLVHGTEENSYHYQHGREFIEKFRELLNKHGVSNWLDNIFVASDGQGPGIKPLLFKINEERDKYTRALEEYEKTNEEFTKLRRTLGMGGNIDVSPRLIELYNRLQNMLVLELFNLVEEYKSILYEGGLINEYFLSRA